MHVLAAEDGREFRAARVLLATPVTAYRPGGLALSPPVPELR